MSDLPFMVDRPFVASPSDERRTGAAEPQPSNVTPGGGLTGEQLLRRALETSRCPLPVYDAYTVRECIDAGHCGCDNRAALAPELPWVEFDLPMPPSVNKVMTKLGNRTPTVMGWIAIADFHFVSQRLPKRLTRIRGPFEAQFLFRRDRSDFHNREKVLFDYLQRVQIIENDKLCEWRASGWGDAPLGVRVRLRPWCPP
jgi:hypothetical protein